MEYAQLYINRIRQLCKVHSITINRLATVSNIRQSTLDNIIRGLTQKSPGENLAQNRPYFRYDACRISEFLPTQCMGV